MAIQEIYSTVWKTGVVPRDWRKAVIVSIHKKQGDQLVECPW